MHLTLCLCEHDIFASGFWSTFLFFFFFEKGGVLETIVFRLSAALVSPVQFWGLSGAF
jgi:hypothetical protein